MAFMFVKHRIYRSIVNGVFFAVLLSLCGCFTGGIPRLRLGCYPTSTPGTRFIDPNHLGPHSYDYNFFEKNGIIYTCRGGHIDITHLRIAADHTRYLARKVRYQLIKGNENFSFRQVAEPSVYHVKINYPENWNQLSRGEKTKIADEISPRLGQYLAFTSSTWHEILTWFGYKCMAVIPESPSAFSWEDIYSNVMGTDLGARAVADRKHPYDKAMTILLDNEVKKLDGRSVHTAFMAAETKRGQWFTGTVAVDMKRRNFDIGTDDGFISPVLNENTCPGAEPFLYPAPNTEFLSEYGFGFSIEIEPKEWEQGAILKIVFPDGQKDRISPPQHFPVIMDFIKRQAADYGYTF